MEGTEGGGPLEGVREGMRAAEGATGRNGSNFQEQIDCQNFGVKEHYLIGSGVIINSGPSARIHSRAPSLPSRSPPLNP